MSIAASLSIHDFPFVAVLVAADTAVFAAFADAADDTAAAVFADDAEPANEPDPVTTPQNPHGHNIHHHGRP